MLFTDIEGSTTLARVLGADWKRTLTQHNRILQRVIESNRGYVADREGDSFLASFEAATDAVTAASEAQRELAAAAWPGERSVRVRMGLHTGAVELSDFGYVGLEVHRAARVAAAAHGGQVLATTTTRGLAHETAFEFEYVGEHRLKDFPRAEPLFQLVVDGRRAADFPPLRTDVFRRTNLQEDLRPLIGREREIDELTDLLHGRARLVTVLGPGGVGKTRLALAAARRLLDEMSGGVFQVPLASLSRPEELLPAITRVLDVTEIDGPPEEQIAAFVGDRPTLLVLDSFEQLLEAAPLLQGLVSRCQELRLVITSQAPLRVTGETIFVLDALELDGAVRLFAQSVRGSAVGASQSLDDEAAIRAICVHIGGLPLAIELAAARVSVLSPRELLRRLQDSSEVLRSVARDAPARQRSLYATFEWTHNLLAAQERVLFRRLGVFNGAAPLEAIEAICRLPAAGQSVDVLDALAELLDFSLVRRSESIERGLRFTQPQALRDFARAQLEASEEAQAIRRRHAEHVLETTSRTRVWYTAEPTLVAAVLRIDSEIRPALAWARASDPRLHRLLVYAVVLGFVRRGRVTEALELTNSVGTGWRDPEDEIDAWIANCRAYALEKNNQVAAGLATLAPAIEFYRRTGDAVGLGLSLNTAGWLEVRGGDRGRALELSRESLELLRTSGDVALTGRGLMLVVQLLVLMRRTDEAEQMLMEAAALVVDAESSLANGVLSLSGDLSLLRKQFVPALDSFVRSIELAVRRSDRIQVTNDAHGIAYALALGGYHEAALEAEGVANAIAADEGHSVMQLDELAETLVESRALLGGAASEILARGHLLAQGERARHLINLADLASRSRKEEAPRATRGAGPEPG